MFSLTERMGLGDSRYAERHLPLCQTTKGATVFGYQRLRTVGQYSTVL